MGSVRSIDEFLKRKREEGAEGSEREVKGNYKKSNKMVGSSKKVKNLEEMLVRLIQEVRKREQERERGDKRGD